MTVNVGTADRIFRAVLGVALLVLAFGGVSEIFASGALKWIAAAAGVVMLGTAALRSCPLYALFGIRTCKL